MFRRGRYELVVLDLMLPGMDGLAVCQRLWTEEVIEHRGRFFEFPPVMFEPKPVQKPHPPILVGGESEAALRRAARVGDGWLGLDHTPESAARLVARIEALREEEGRSEGRFEFVVGARPADRDEVRRFEDAGVTRIISTPWRRSRDAVDGMHRQAEALFG